MSRVSNLQRLRVSQLVLGGQPRGERSADHKVQIGAQRERLQVLQEGELQAGCVEA